MSVHEGSPSKALVTFSSRAGLPECWDGQVLTQGEAYSEGGPQVGRGLWKGSLLL